MSEERTTATRVERVSLYCDCSGEMRRTNTMLCTNPPLYPTEDPLVRLARIWFGVGDE